MITALLMAAAPGEYKLPLPMLPHLLVYKACIDMPTPEDVERRIYDCRQVRADLPAKVRKSMWEAGSDDALQDVRQFENVLDQVDREARAEASLPPSERRSAWVVANRSEAPKAADGTLGPARRTALDIPPLIAPAVMPYFDCVAASAGKKVRRDGQVVEPPVARGADCSQMRGEASRAATTLINAAPDRPVGSGPALVEAALRSIDTFFVDPAPPIPPTEKAK